MYDEHFQKLIELKADAFRGSSSWFRHLTLVAAAVLSIQISMGNNSSDHNYQFLSSLLLLSCILCSLIASWFEIHALKSLARKYHKELTDAAEEGRDVYPISGRKPKIFSIAEVVAVLSFVSSCVLLVVD